MKSKYNLAVMAPLAVFFILIDQITKYIIATSMAVGDSFNVVGDFLRITSHRNYGAAWGMLQDRMVFFYIVTIIVIGFIIYFYKNEAGFNPLMQFGLTLVFAGAVGNFIDRLFRGNVVDFIDTTIINYDFPIFNVADSCLTVGVMMLIIVMFQIERKEKKDANI